MKKLYVYALEINSEGRWLHRFASSQERQSWNTQLFRESPKLIAYPIESTHPDVRRVKRRIAQGEVADKWPVKLDY